MSSHVPPLTPARATTADSLAPMTIGGGLAVGDAGGQLEVPVLSRPHLGRHEHHRLAQALDELEQQLVHRDRAGEPLAERAQRLVGRDPLAVDEPVGPLGEPAAGRQVEQRRQPGGDHRQQQQRPFVVGRRAAEAEDDDDVDGDDERRQPGDRDGVGEQAIDAGDHRRQRPAARGRSGSNPVRARATAPALSGQSVSSRRATTTMAASAATAMPQPIHCIRRRSIGAGLDVADVAGVQTERRGPATQSTATGQIDQAVPVGHQRRRRRRPRRRSRRSRRAAGSASPAARRRARTAGAWRRPGAARREAQARGPRPTAADAVERAVLDHRRGERADAADDGAAEDDRRQAVVTPAHAEDEPGDGPQDDDERADDLDRRAVRRSPATAAPATASAHGDGATSRQYAGRSGANTGAAASFAVTASTRRARPGWSSSL